MDLIFSLVFRFCLWSLKRKHISNIINFYHTDCSGVSRFFVFKVFLNLKLASFPNFSFLPQLNGFDSCGTQFLKLSPDHANMNKYFLKSGISET